MNMREYRKHIRIAFIAIAVAVILVVWGFKEILPILIAKGISG